jgi:hypothetical protein
MTGLFTTPFKITIDKPELTRRRIKTKVKNAFKSISVDYRGELKPWIDANVPKDTGRLIESLKLSVDESHVEETPHMLRLILHLFTDVEHASHVNEMVRVNWSNPPRVYQFWDDWLVPLAQETIMNAAPRHFQAEGLM